MEKLLLLLTCLMFFILVTAGILSKVFQGKIQLERRFVTLQNGGEATRSTEESVEEDFEEEQAKLSFKERVFKPIWERFGNWMFGKMSMHTTKVLEKKLADAGRPFQLTPVDYRLLQVMLGAGFFLIVLLPFLSVAEDKGNTAIMAGVAGFFGFIYPNYYLNAKRKYRIKMIQKMMPDFFDMVNVSIEAGMGLDMALARVCKRMIGPLSDEFMRALEDMKLGQSRREAFSGLRDRVPSEEFQSVMSALIQADQLGIGIAKVIRAQTHRIREHRRQQAKEQALKAPVKMMIPMVLFMFPTLFIVLLGPIVVRLVTNWL